MKNRAAFILKEQKLDHDIIEAITHEIIGVMYYTIDKANLLQEKKRSKQFKSIQEAFIRTLNLGTKHTVSMEIDPILFETSSEKNLYNQLNNVIQQIDNF